MELNYLEIGKRLREARKNINISQQQLADIMGVSASYIKNTENGAKPSIKYLFTVVETCNVSFDWLLAGRQIQCIPPTAPDYKFETEEILGKLRTLLNDSDPDIRSWAKVQIKKAFAEYFEDK
ncbi:MAG: XRE family transcriptional regulator [Negativicutes bacterium]|nr:XRE family transcriptional regulator [Negativicutes bacterium]